MEFYVETNIFSHICGILKNSDGPSELLKASNKTLKGLNAFLNRIFTSSSLNQYNIAIKIENRTELGSEIQVKAPPTPSDGISALFITVSIKLSFNKSNL